MYWRRDDGGFVGIRSLDLLPDGCGRLVLADGGEVTLAPDDAHALQTRLDYRSFSPRDRAWPPLARVRFAE
jgi:hypothetical protein